MMWDGGWFGGWLGMFWMLLFWVGVILVVIWAVGAWNRDRSAPRRSRALEILEERFARGEIDRDEFEARRRDLERV